MSRVEKYALIFAWGCSRMLLVNMGRKDYYATPLLQKLSYARAIYLAGDAALRY